MTTGLSIEFYNGEVWRHMIEEVKKRVKEYKRGMHPEYNSPNQWGANGGADCIAFLDALEKAEAEIAELKNDLSVFKSRAELHESDYKRAEKYYDQNLVLAAQVVAMREALESALDAYRQLDESTIGPFESLKSKRGIIQQALSTPPSAYEEMVKAWKELENRAAETVSLRLRLDPSDLRRKQENPEELLARALEAVRKAEKSL